MARKGEKMPWSKTDHVALSLSSEMREAWVDAATRCGYRSLAQFVRDAVCSHMSNSGMGDLLVGLNGGDLPLNVKENHMLKDYGLDVLRGLSTARMPVPIDARENWFKLFEIERYLDHY